jgi:hypothetical protein
MARNREIIEEYYTRLFELCGIENSEILTIMRFEGGYFSRNTTYLNYLVDSYENKNTWNLLTNLIPTNQDSARRVRCS